MRYPFVEQENLRWEYETIYHNPESDYFKRLKPSEVRADVDHINVCYADVLRDITELGGVPDDIADATLYWVANASACEMRISTTTRALTRVGALWGSEPGEGLSERLRARAEDLLAGAALVGTLRAIAWHLSRVTPPSTYRRSLAATAREEYRRCELVSGEADLIADDAHAHISIAERFRPGHGELRDSFLFHGIALLGAAHVQALLEPWNPFVLHRLGAEMREHAAAIEEVADLLPKLANDLIQAVNTTETLHAQSNARFADATARHRGDDMAAYFENRADSPGNLDLTDLPEPCRTLRELEPTLARLT